MDNLKFIGIFFLLIVGLNVSAQTFTLKSNSLSGQANQEMFFNGFVCDGKNISPHLSWENPPELTKSFAITIQDQNAPTDSGFWHWMVIDIPTDINEIQKNKSGELSIVSPEIIETNTDFGSPGFSGPCPPKNDKPHRYIITIYALNVEKLGLPVTTTPAIVSFYLNDSVIEKSSLVFYAKR